MGEDLPDLTPEEVVAARIHKRDMRQYEEKERQRRGERERVRDEMIVAVSVRLTSCPACGESYSTPLEEDALHQPYGMDPLPILYRYCSNCGRSTYVDLD